MLILPIRFYQWIGSPLKNALLGAAGSCRFSPTCSTYAIEAIRRFGCWRGTWLAIVRVCRCHPWGGCGDDPVPPLKDDTSNKVRVAARRDLSMRFLPFPSSE